jgi:hypothetical protein
MALLQPKAYAVKHAQERRRHQRVRVNLLGRYMLSDRQEYPCQVVNMSPGGMALIAPTIGQVGERVIAYVDHLGRLEGSIARTLVNGFAMTISATPRKRDKLAAQLTWLANRNELEGDAERRHDRITPDNTVSQLHLAEGIVLACRVLDVSISGASVATPARPEVGTEVVLGKLRARVVRHHAQGFGVQFLDIQNPTALRRYFG